MYMVFWTDFIPGFGMVCQNFFYGFKAVLNIPNVFSLNLFQLERKIKRQSSRTRYMYLDTIINGAHFYIVAPFYHH